MKPVVVVLSLGLFALGASLLAGRVDAVVTKRGGGAACRPFDFQNNGAATVGTDGITVNAEQTTAFVYCEVHGISTSITIEDFTVHWYDAHTLQRANALAFVRTNPGGTFFTNAIESTCATGGPCGYKTASLAVNESYSNVVSYGVRVQLHGVGHGPLLDDPQSLLGWSIDVD